MPRPLRIEHKNAWYHVMNRGAGYRVIYSSDECRQLFLEVLAEASELWGIEIHAYCLMDNHYHLLIKTPHGNLARAMRHINGVYTQRYNRLQKTDGPLFRGRYKAIVVEADPYLLQVSRYIHLNPVTAKLVSKPEGYLWSSYRYYLAKTKPDWLHTTDILSWLNSKQPLASYKRFMQEPMDAEIKQFYDKQHTPMVLGSEGYKNKLLSKLSRSQQKGSSTDYRRTQSLPSLTTINHVCACYFKVKQEALFQSCRGQNNEVRKIAIYGCRMWGMATLAAISNHYGFNSHSYVTKVTKDIQTKAATDPKFATLLKCIAKKVAA